MRAPLIASMLPAVARPNVGAHAGLVSTAGTGRRIVTIGETPPYQPVPRVDVSGEARDEENLRAKYRIE